MPSISIRMISETRGKSQIGKFVQIDSKNIKQKSVKNFLNRINMSPFNQSG